MDRTLLTSESTELDADESANTLEVLLAGTQQRSRLDRPAPVTGNQLPGVVIGRLFSFGLNGEPLVTWPTQGEDVPCPARSVLTMERRHLGAEVVLSFENGNPDSPIILGLLTPAHVDTATPLEVAADEDRLELKANREIVLRCGEASITLTRAGKVLIRGAYVLSRSSGVNRIKGGSVQIN